MVISTFLNVFMFKQIHGHVNYFILIKPSLFYFNKFFPKTLIENLIYGYIIYVKLNRKIINACYKPLIKNWLKFVI